MRGGPAGAPHCPHPGGNAPGRDLLWWASEALLPGGDPQAPALWLTPADPGLWPALQVRKSHCCSPPCGTPPSSEPPHHQLRPCPPPPVCPPPSFEMCQDTLACSRPPQLPPHSGAHSPGTAPPRALPSSHTQMVNRSAPQPYPVQPPHSAPRAEPDLILVPRWGGSGESSLGS